MRVMARPKVLHADGVIPGDAAPLTDGAVVLDEGGLVLDVGRADEVLPRHAGAAVERVRGAILPGLVNAHTHLELSALRGHVPGGAGFVAWVERLIGARVEHSPEDDEEAIARAVHELDLAGTAAVGEVTNTLAAAGALARAGFAGCLFHEIFGVHREGVMRRVRALLEDVDERLGRWSAPLLSYALAPHTLYTTHPDAVRAIAAFARARGRRTSLHLAEHAGERRALEHGDGPVVAWLEARVKIAPEWPRMGPIDLAEELGFLAPSALLVHLADAKDDELAKVARAGAPVVLCPRSNLYIEGRLPPLLAMRAHGIAPALGTDSLASSPSLDVLAEARALADRFSQVPARDLVQMATWNGARALGLEELGRIAKGARPGIVAIDGDLEGAEPCAWILRHVKAPRRRLTSLSGA
jgi:cytosine/adenosine deaminase-related metal-dependent hydrolase